MLDLVVENFFVKTKTGCKLKFTITIFNVFIFVTFLFLPYPALCKGPITKEEVSLRFKIGQMIMAGFRGYHINDEHSIAFDVEKRNLGGVILFDYDLRAGSPKRNIKSPEQVKQLIEELKSRASSPLLVAADYEGGKIVRLKERFGFPATLSPEALGRKNDAQLTYRESLKMATTLHDLGFNINLAPVVDVRINDDNPVIARLGRSFSVSPGKVTDHAIAFIKGHRARGMLTSLKHFPGHGSSSTDSHLRFTDITKTWTKDELIPFEKIIREGMADTVMIAHVYNARLDKDYPATLSKKIVTGMLRKELGFEGLVFSDDIEMKAIADNFSLETTLLRTINAGVDMIITAYNRGEDGSDTVGDMILTVEKLVKEGKISRERIDKSYERIRALKKRITVNNKVAGTHISSPSVQ